MKYAIIAAGDGSRLAQEGVSVPKPLVQVGGEGLLHRLLRIFMACNATEILVVSNATMPQVEAQLCAIGNDGIGGRTVPLRHLSKTTPSSMHSFYELSAWLQGDEPFVLTTVDTVFREDEFHAYVSDFVKALSEGKDGLMGVTRYVDDEKPLYVTADSRQHITGFWDERPERLSSGSPAFQDSDELFVSAGIYGLTPKTLLTLKACVERGESRMRNFQRALLRDGLDLSAWPFTKVLDVDHREDIEKAEVFLNEEKADEG